jgi:hypothetical protein
MMLLGLHHLTNLKTKSIQEDKRQEDETGEIAINQFV